MLNTTILSYVTFVYFAAFTLYLLMMVMGRPAIGRPATACAALGLLGEEAMHPVLASTRETCHYMFGSAVVFELLDLL